MDSIEEAPVFDLNPTYLDDEEFDQFLIHHWTLVSDYVTPLISPSL